MKKEILTKNIDYLNLDNNIITKLNSNNVLTIDDLWKTNRHILKDYCLKPSEIKEVIIKLQLNGMDLNHKKY